MSVDESLLVKPSGLLTSKLAHYLHEPSYTTSRIANDETADITNGCIALIMSNAFRKDQTLLFDHMHRRSEQPKGLEEYPTQVRQCHKTFIRQLLESSQAKVVMIYEKKVQDRIMRNPNYDLTILPLWDTLDGYFIAIDHENNYHNADEGFRARRILVFAAHPQRLFYEPIQSERSKNQDLITFIATCMAATGLICKDQYYANRLWRQNMRECFLRAIATRSLSLNSAQKFESEFEERQATNASDFPHTESYNLFNKVSHSNESLRSLTIEILNSWSEYENENEWKDIIDFPELVLRWFRGQKYILFRNIINSLLYDIKAALWQFVFDEHRYIKTEGTFLKTLTQHTVLKQKQFLDSQVVGSDSDLLSRQNLWHSAFDQTLKTCGNNCGGSVREDSSSKWAGNRPDHYIASQLFCKSAQCKGKRANWVPVDAHILWVTNAVSKIIHSPHNTKPDWHESLLQATDKENMTLPPTVQSWCIHCKEHTELSGKRSIFVDEEPRWTLGLVRPLCIERAPVCLRCQKLDRPTARFVPLEEDIPSMPRNNLANFQHSFGKFDRNVRSKLLDCWPASSKLSRYYKRWRH